MVEDKDGDLEKDKETLDPLMQGLQTGEIEREEGRKGEREEARKGERE